MEKVQKLFSTLNVSDATMIYKKELNNDSRATAETGYFKLDVNGNEVKLVIKGEKGKTTDISIDAIRNINDRYMAFLPSNYEITEELGNFGTAFFGFVDRATDKIYLGESSSFVGTDGDIIGALDPVFEGTVQTTADGSIYFLPEGQYRNILKVDTRSFTISALLPQGQEFNTMANTGVNAQGYVVYDTHKVLMPSGSIQIINDGTLFVYDGQIYSIAEKLLKWTPEASGRLVPSEIATVEMPLPEYNAEYNSVRNTVLFTVAGAAMCYEFNGTALTAIDGIDRDILWSMTGFHKFSRIETSKAWYRYEGSSFRKVNLADWSTSQFTLNDIEVYTASGNELSPDLAFSGLRFSTAGNVFGYILPDNSVRIDGETPANIRVSNLIPLN